MYYFPLDGRKYLGQGLLWSKTYKQCLSRPSIPLTAVPFLLSLQVIMINSVFGLHRISEICSFSFCNTTNSCVRSYHPLHLQIHVSRINHYRYSFFVNVPFLWNVLPDLVCVYVVLLHLEVSVSLLPFCIFLLCVCCLCTYLLRGAHYIRFFFFCEPCTVLQIKSNQQRF